MSDIKTYDPYYAGPVATDAPVAPATVVEPEPVPAPVEVDDVPALEVPEGSAAKILAWVGEDRERASAALVAEEAGQARKTLVAKLQAILEG